MVNIKNFFNLQYLKLYIYVINLQILNKIAVVIIVHRFVDIWILQLL